MDDENGENGENVSANAVTRPHFLGRPPDDFSEPHRPPEPRSRDGQPAPAASATPLATPPSDRSCAPGRVESAIALSMVHRRLPIFARERHSEADREVHRIGARVL